MIGDTGTTEKNSSSSLREPVSVRTLEKGREAHWEAFVRECPHASFYHRYLWLGILEKEFGHETIPLIAYRGEQVRGVLPLVLLRSRIFGSILCSIPFLNFGGPASLDEDTDRDLIIHARQIARERQVDYLELRSTRRLPVDLEVSTNKISMTLALSNDAEDLWSGFSSKHRTNVRRAYKSGLSVRKGGIELLPEFFDVLSRAWRDQGTPIYRRSFFERITVDFGNAIDIFICDHQGEPVATALNGTFGSTVEGMWAGATPRGRQLQYSYVLYWEMIKDACARGFETYHLGRSSADSGSEAFKRKWRATATQLYWHFDLIKSSQLPGLNVDNPKYAAAIKLWQRLPVHASRLIGPLLARGIP